MVNCDAASNAKDPWEVDNMLHGFVLRQQLYNMPVDSLDLDLSFGDSGSPLLRGSGGV